MTSAEGGLLGRPLRWRYLPPSPGQWQPPPRSRHSALCLPGLQLPAAPPPGAAGYPLPPDSALRASLTRGWVQTGGLHGEPGGGLHVETLDLRVSAL